ncbi:hypothetical protein EDB85DRAFT_1889595 [Lactarius pseudohatsudake]|nr:hypothetical protein EDB85DRAFT_1889595 [Lactarius pseudohatsudake]
MSLSARSRTTSNMGTAGHPARPGLDQPRFTLGRGLRVNIRDLHRGNRSAAAQPKKWKRVPRVYPFGWRGIITSVPLHHFLVHLSHDCGLKAHSLNLTARRSILPRKRRADTSDVTPVSSLTSEARHARLPLLIGMVLHQRYTLHPHAFRNAGPTQPSHIPVRSPGRVPKIKNGDAKEFTDGHRRATTEFAEANGAIPPMVRIQPSPGPELESTPSSELENLGTPWSVVQDLRIVVESSYWVFSESDESSAQDVLAPIARPIEVPPPNSEKLQSPPPAESLLAQAERQSNPSFDASSLPTSPRLALSIVTPVRV